MDDLCSQPFPSPQPFNAIMLRKLLQEDVLKGGQTIPGLSDLEQLAASLNRLHATFAFARDVGNGSKPLADKVRASLEMLISF